MASDPEKELGKLQEWIRQASYSLIWLLTGLLGWLWNSGIDSKLGSHDRRLETHESTFSTNDKRLTVMETESKRTKEDVDELKQQLKSVCRDTHRC